MATRCHFANEVKQMKKKLDKLENLLPDPNSANSGTERGNGMIRTSLQRCGAGRSIVVAKDGTTIAGKHVLETAAEIGLEAEFVHTDGTKLVVVVRDDLDPDSETAKELAIADNRTSQVNLEWNEGLLEAAEEIDLSLYWSDAELEKFQNSLKDKDDLGLQDEEEVKEDFLICPHCGRSIAEIQQKSKRRKKK